MFVKENPDRKKQLLNVTQSLATTIAAYYLQKIPVLLLLFFLITKKEKNSTEKFGGK